MNRREFLAASSVVASSALIAGCASGSADLLTSTHSSAAGASRSGQGHRDTRMYELRIYTINPGKAEALHNRFRTATLRLFKKHGIDSVGYWMPVDSNDLRLHFLLRYPSREARESSWKAFMADPEWQSAYKASEAAGPILAKSPESYFLNTTDYSPAASTGNISHGGVFELRTYTTPPGRLSHLDARFRDHTIRLFAEHGMGNWGYFHRVDGQPESEVTLQYFLHHASPAAAKKSFDGFRLDPRWDTARKASEAAAGGSLTVANGVKSTFLKPTDYSPTR